MGLSLYYTAYFDLTSDRSVGMGEGPIPWTSIERYCDAFGIEGEQREDMHFFLREMDRAYLGHRAKEATNQVESPPRS